MPTCNNCLAEHNNYFKNGNAKKSCGNKCKKYKLHRQKTLNEFCEDHIEWFPYYKLLPYDDLWKADKCEGYFYEFERIVETCNFGKIKKIL